jgi:hypothetical protein
VFCISGGFEELKPHKFSGRNVSLSPYRFVEVVVYENVSKRSIFLEDMKR